MVKSGEYVNSWILANETSRFSEKIEFSDSTGQVDPYNVIQLSLFLSLKVVNENYSFYLYCIDCILVSGVSWWSQVSSTVTKRWQKSQYRWISSKHRNGFVTLIWYSLNFLFHLQRFSDRNRESIYVRWWGRCWLVVMVVTGRVREWNIDFRLFFFFFLTTENENIWIYFSIFIFQYLMC